jgi:hypothetical protein
MRIVSQNLTGIPSVDTSNAYFGKTEPEPHEIHSALGEFPML